MAHDDPDFTLKLGDTREAIRGTLYDALGAVILASDVVSLKFRMKKIGAAAWAIDMDAAAVTGGKAEFDWVEAAASDFPSETGFYHAQFHGQVDGQHQSFPTDGSLLIKVSD